MISGPTATPPPPRACRPGCAACCIAPSISSPLPGLPNGKPAGVPCPHLDDALRCRLFGRPERPAVCSSLPPSPDMCGDSREQALRWLGHLETETQPAPPAIPDAPSMAGCAPARNTASPGAEGIP